MSIPDGIVYYLMRRNSVYTEFVKKYGLYKVMAIRNDADGDTIVTVDREGTSFDNDFPFEPAYGERLLTMPEAAALRLQHPGLKVFANE